MALLGTRIDKRTLACPTTLDVATFAHALGGTPDAVYVRHIATIATAATVTQWYNINAAYDATNVTLQNEGNITGPNIEVCTVRFHSIIQ